MNNLAISPKTLLSLALFGAFNSAVLAQDAKPAAPQAAQTEQVVQAVQTAPTAPTTVQSEVLNSMETRQFFAELRRDLAEDGYHVSFGDTLPHVTIHAAPMPTKAMTDEEQKAFFARLQQSLADSGIEVNFGEKLPHVERIIPDDIGCSRENVWDDFDDLATLSARYDDRHQPRYDETDNDTDWLEILLLKRYIDRLEGRDRPPLRVGDDVTEELLELLLKNNRDFAR